MSRRTGIRLIRTLVALPALWVAAAVSAAAAAPAGQMTWAVHITLAPRWLDPGDNEGAITPFLTLYAVRRPPQADAGYSAPYEDLRLKTTP
jgi:hypothetical protein